MRHFVHQAQRLHCFRSGAAADNCRYPFLAGDGLGYHAGPLAETVHLEHAHGTVPDDGLAAGQAARKLICGCGRYIHDKGPVGDPVSRHGLNRGRRGSKLAGHHDLLGKVNIDGVFLGTFQYLPGEVQPVLFDTGGPGVAAHSVQEGDAHPATDEQVVQLAQEIFQHQYFVAYLGSPHQSRQWLLRRLQGTAHRVDFLLNEEPHSRRQIFGEPDGRGMGAVGHGEGIHHEGVGQARQRLGKLGRVFLLTSVKPQILKQHNVSGCHTGDGGLHFRAVNMRQAANRVVKQDSQTVSNGSQPQFFHNLPSRAAQVGAKDDPAALVDQVANSRQSGAEALVVKGDGLNSLFDRDVEIDPH